MKTIVITGASRRLGLYLAEQFIAKGDRVFAISRSQPNEFTSIDSPHFHPVQIDSYDKHGVEQAVSAISAKVERIDLLVNNASVFEQDPDNSQDIETKFIALFQVHMLFPNLLTHELKRYMFDEENPGVLVNMTDIYAENPMPERSLYCSTKAGLENLTRSFAKKFAPGIRCNSIMPGPLQFLPDHTQEQKEQVLKGTLLPFEAGFHPVFQTIDFIMSNHFVTGTSIKVDGGRSICRG
ncbi:pteridine reductase 1 [Shewanella hanedai]|uniref:Dihydromonapterin reductase n=1 Tax=Shewanella hanedai TaxID=25 RepID=A0A553JLP9_SHEHA|nr:SDR family NAD(P)-dependent oxidoreductase [Shewanella hanedai]TRY13404.1 SDR family NAD(P)-dependent oxidoreductase [Shewanella hanedai]GGI87971.1 pteridine reductase 1 [Shewanella hanedai]